MQRSILAVLAALAAALTIAQGAQAGPAAPPVPSDIAAPAGHKPYLVGHAAGVQIYECTSAGAWRLVAPRATLTGDNGKPLAEHYGGPTWQTRDGSAVVARRDAGVNVDPTAIDWLRLAVTSATPGADGDRLGGTTYIQRINTVGGLAPAAADCDAGTAGERREIPYTADYVFFKATGS